MPLPVPALDHVVVNVRDQIDAAAERWRRLGFHLTPKGHHTLGSVNHLAIFGTDYLELLGVEPGGPGRTDVLDWPRGLNGLVLKSWDADATYAALSGAGAPVEPPLQFSRPVEYAGGTGDAAFRVVRMRREAVPSGRLFFCAHETPGLVWRDEWRHHPNGVTGIEAGLVCADDPRALAALFVQMFGEDAVRRRPDGATVSVGLSRFEVATPATLSAVWGNALPGAAGRTEWMAGLVLRTASLDRAADALRAGGIAMRRESDHILVPAAEADDVALMFRE